jgi:hypothetical protein
MLAESARRTRKLLHRLNLSLTQEQVDTLLSEFFEQKGPEEWLL